MSRVYEHERKLTAVERNWKENDCQFSEQDIVYIESYCCYLDPARAAREAGYSYEYAAKLRRFPPVQNAIQERLREQKVNPAEVVFNAGRIMRTDLRDFLRVERWNDEQGIEQTRIALDIESAIRDDTMYGIKRITFYRDGSVKDIELENRLAAIEMIGKLYSLFPESQREADDRSLLERIAALPFDDASKADELAKILRALRPAPQMIDGETAPRAETEDTEPDSEPALGG